MRRRIAPVAALAVSAAAFLLAHQTSRPLRFDIGAWDRALLADPGQVYPAETMTGPIRHPDMSVEVVAFRARLTRRRAVITLPYHALGTRVELNVRCHRFGLGGTVVIGVNGRFRDEAEFSDRSYPWAGVRLTVPREAAAAGPLRISFETVGGAPPRSNMPADLGIGLDWIEVRPLDAGAWFLPAARQWAWFALLMGMVAFVCWQLDLSSRRVAGVLAATGLAVSLLLVRVPVWTAVLLPYAWWPMPLIAYLVWIDALARCQPFPELPGSHDQDDLTAPTPVI